MILVPHQVDRTTGLQLSNFGAKQTSADNLPQRPVRDPVVPLVFILDLKLPREEHGLFVLLDEPLQGHPCLIFTRIRLSSWLLKRFMKVFVRQGPR